MSVATIALNTTNTCWSQSVSDLIAFGSNHGPSECFVALSILKNICVIYSTKVFSSQKTALIKRWLRESVSGVFDYLSQILSTPRGSLPHEIYFETFSAAKYWCQYSKKSFIVN